MCDLNEITSKHFPNASRSKQVINRIYKFTQEGMYYLPSGWGEKLFKASEQDVDCKNQENL